MTIDQILSAHKTESDTTRAIAKRVFLTSWGIREDGIGYAVLLGWNDSKRDEKVAELKQHGFHYNAFLKAWISKEEICRAARIDFSKMIVYGSDELYHFTSDAKNAIVSQYLETNKPESTKSGYVGEIGEHVKIALKPEGESIVPSDSDFGDFHVFYFKDDDGNSFSWFQRTYSYETLKLFMKSMKVDKVYVFGTIKNHATRLGVKTNYLTRCDICANGHHLCDFASALRDRKSA